MISLFKVRYYVNIVMWYFLYVHVLLGNNIFNKVFGVELICILTSSYSFALDALGVVFSMKIDGVEFVRPFNESTDPNKQLGRPNQYIDKVSWPDPLVDPKFESDGHYDSDIDFNDYVGGTIEQFRNTADLNRRYNYIKKITLHMPTLNQYMYKKGLFLMRLDKEFTPTQAKEYEKKFYRVVK